MPSPPKQIGEALECTSLADREGQGGSDGLYSYTQISQYLRCPRSYRYRYLDGLAGKRNTAAMVFGRCFEKALGAYFGQEDSAAVLFKGMECIPRWSFLNTAKESPGTVFSTKASICSKHLRGMIAFGFRRPKKNLQIKILRALSGGSEFVAYLDAIGEIDGRPLPDRLEDNNQPIFNGTRGIARARRSTHLLFLDQRDFGSSTGRIRAEACSRNPILESVHLGRAAPRIREPCRNNDWPDRSGSVCFAHRHPLSAKRMHELRHILGLCLKKRAVSSG